MLAPTTPPAPTGNAVVARAVAEANVAIAHALGFARSAAAAQAAAGAHAVAAIRALAAAHPAIARATGAGATGTLANTRRHSRESGNPGSLFQGNMDSRFRGNDAAGDG
jgi:hypothetical protein